MCVRVRVYVSFVQVAGHELKGVITYFNVLSDQVSERVLSLSDFAPYSFISIRFNYSCATPTNTPTPFLTHKQEVRLPMLALVDYFGFRLIVISLLPIDK